MRIYKDPAVGAAKGQWRAITASNSIDFQVNYGMQIRGQYANSLTHENAEFVLDYQMGLGIVMNDGGKPLKAYAGTVKEDAQQAYSRDIT